jgi:hypothetical protein
MTKVAAELMISTGFKFSNLALKYAADTIAEQPPDVQSAVKEAVEITFPESCSSASKISVSPFKSSGSVSNVARLVFL